MFLVVGKDYQQQLVQVSLQPPLMDSVQILLGIVDDDIVENRENFRVNISLTNSQVSVLSDHQVTEVYILDNDCETHKSDNSMLCDCVSFEQI